MRFEQKLLQRLGKMRIYNGKEFSITKRELSIIDWNYLLDLSISHRVIILVYKYLEKYIPEDVKDSYEKQYKKIMSQMDEMLEEVGFINGLAVDNGINLILIKGYVNSKLLYDNLYDRVHLDFEFLVSEEQGPLLHRLMIENGYYQSLKSDAKLRKLRPLKFNGSHEYVEYFNENHNRYKREISTGLHIVKNPNLSLFWETSEWLQLNDFKVRCFNLEHLLIHLCENIFNDEELMSKYRLRNYIDLGLFISKYSEKINWCSLKIYTDEIKVSHAIYYSFSKLKKLYPHLISNEVIEIFSIRNLKYDTSSILENGGISNYKTPFIERVLDCDLDFSARKKYILEKAIYTNIRNYSGKNIHYRTPYIISAYNFRELCGDKQYRNFEVEKYDFKLNYAITYNEQKIYFSFMVPKRVLESSADLRIKIEVLNHVGDDLASEIVDFKEISHVRYLHISANNTVERILYNDKFLLELEVYINEIIGEEGLYCYRISVEEFLEEGYYTYLSDNLEGYSVARDWAEFARCYVSDYKTFFIEQIDIMAHASISERLKS